MPSDGSHMDYSAQTRRQIVNELFDNVAKQRPISFTKMYRATVGEP